MKGLSVSAARFQPWPSRCPCMLKNRHHGRGHCALFKSSNNKRMDWLSLLPGSSHGPPAAHARRSTGTTEGGTSMFLPSAPPLVPPSSSSKPSRAPPGGCVFVYLRVCVCVCVRVCMRVWVCVCAWGCVRASGHVMLRRNVKAHTRTYTHKCKHACAHTQGHPSLSTPLLLVITIMYMLDPTPGKSCCAIFFKHHAVLCLSVVPCPLAFFTSLQNAYLILYSERRSDTHAHARTHTFTHTHTHVHTHL